MDESKSLEREDELLHFFNDLTEWPLGLIP